MSPDKREPAPAPLARTVSARTARVITTHVPAGPAPATAQGGDPR